jgi:Reverse transcriptase (RNA-dependent DNA polymerase)
VYDQSFSKRTLERVLQKSDFRKITAITQPAFKATQLKNAMVAADSIFSKPENPLISFNLMKKNVYKFSKLPDELVARKLCENLKNLVESNKSDRASIVKNLQILLEEGIPYRIYRLDIKSFYESFYKTELIDKVDSIVDLSPQSKVLIKSLLTSHASIGGSGVPRGLALSAVLSDLMMNDFDTSTFTNPCVYFYARYVDDIIILTSGQEKSIEFINCIEMNLPSGLKLNEYKKSVVGASKRVDPGKIHPSTELFSFDYLGYLFNVYEPVRDKSFKRPTDQSRLVSIDIANSKIKKIKTRIVRSFLQFQKNSDWNLLLDRIKFLTQNFSVYNNKAGSKKLAGIYHSYPQVTFNAKGLKDLDGFMIKAVLSKTGKLFANTGSMLNGSQKRKLLGQSFRGGHESKNFVHFSALRISQIQECWKN